MKTTDPKTSSPQSVGVCQSISAILWPSFIVAGIANTIFFSVFSPSEMAACRGGETLSTTAVYSIGFFSFWALTAVSSFVTQYFLKPCDNKKNC